MTTAKRGRERERERERERNNLFFFLLSFSPFLSFAISKKNQSNTSRSGYFTRWRWRGKQGGSEFLLFFVLRFCYEKKRSTKHSSACDFFISLSLSSLLFLFVSLDSQCRNLALHHHFLRTKGLSKRKSCSLLRRCFFAFCLLK